MMWGYIKGDRGRPPMPLSLPIETYCHALLTGSSGSGKSTALLFLLGSLLKSDPTIDVYFCDMKREFTFLNEYPHYYPGESCYEGIKAYYECFCKEKALGIPQRRKLLIVEEYVVSILYFQTLDKQAKTKKAEEMQNIIAQILMLGRGLKYGIWLVCQRPDAHFFPHGVRLNVMVTIALGRLDPEILGMVFPGEKLSDKIYRPGEGQILCDSHSLLDICYPLISNPVDWKKHIKEILMRYST